MKSKILKHLLVLIGVVLPLQLMGIIILLPVVAINQYCARKYNTSYKLPYLLRWFDNADIYVGRDAVTYLVTVIPKGILYRYYWLAIRNPLNYFGYAVLGLIANNSLKVISETNNPYKVGDTTHDGLYTAVISLDDKEYFEYYRIIKYKLFNVTKCIRIRIGYKLQKASETPLNGHIQWVCTLSPFHSYSGE